MAIPARILGSLALFLAAVLGPTIATAQESSGASTTSGDIRVRSGNARLSALITEATDRSPTFKALLASIAATDGIVFVEAGRCRPGVPACLTWKVTLAGSYRILFVLLDTRKPELDLMASMGHELQHALEVLTDRSLRSTAAIQFFYMHLVSSESPPRTVETAAAEATGDAVFREIQRSQSGENK